MSDGLVRFVVEAIIAAISWPIAYYLLGSGIAAWQVFIVIVGSGYIDFRIDRGVQEGIRKSVRELLKSSKAEAVVITEGKGCKS
jgi:hypothetical protein